MGNSESEQQRVLRAAAERHEATLAPALLRAAFSYCAEVLAPEALTTLKRVELLRLLAELVNALQQSKTTLATATGAALAQAVAGARLRDALREGETLLAGRAEELARAREASAPLLQQE